MLSGLCFFAVGALSAAMNIIMGSGFDPTTAGGSSRPNFADSGRDIFFKLCVLGAVMMGCMVPGVLCAMLPKQRQLARWKIAYVKAILRQDVAWYDVNKPQELAARIGDAIVHIEKAHSV